MYNEKMLIERVYTGEISLKAALATAYGDGVRNTEKSNPSEYKMVRTHSAGVFYGVIEFRNGKEVVMRNARRVWYWKGAASLSQLATDGTSNPKECKFPCAVARVELTEVIEILDITPKALSSLDEVSVWKA